MNQTISVAPIGEGWQVDFSALASQMFFHSGASAEAAARRLGMRLAQSGTAVEVLILLRDGTLGGRYAYPVATDTSDRTTCANGAKALPEILLRVGNAPAPGAFAT